MNELSFPLPDQEHIQTKDVIRFARRYRKIILGCVIGGLVIASAYIFNTAPTYTARTQILIDANSAQVLRDRPVNPEVSLDSAKVESQINVLKSETIAQSVIKKLQLEQDSEFKPQPPSLLSVLIGFIKRPFSGQGGGADSDESFNKTRTAVGAFLSNIDVGRAGTSYAIDISYSSKDPEKAARIANAIAQAYIDDQVQTAAKSAKQSSMWLEERLEQLRSQLNTAARQVQLFRSGQNVQPVQQRLYKGPADAPLAIPGPTDTAAPTPTPAPDPKAPAAVTLAELESQAENYRKIYETYLQAFTDAVQRQSFPVGNARILTEATKPLNKSYPKTTLILAFATMLGLLAGVSLSLILNSLRDGIHSARQIREELGLACLAQIPLLPHSMTANIKALGVATREIEVAPFSPFTGAIKYLRGAVETANTSGGVQTIGVISVLPKEGKTTVANNLAGLLSARKKNVILVDLDIHNSSLTQKLTISRRAGIVDLLKGDVSLDSVIVNSTSTLNPSFIPMGMAANPPFSYELFSSDRMANLLIELKRRYDFVILDMPPLRPVVDGLSISAMLDGVILVAEWDQTPVNVLEEAVRGMHTVRAHLLGVALTKVDPQTLSVTGNRDLAYYQ